MPRKIIHLDLDAFFCAVEESHDPSLRGKAFAVGGKPEERGVVASCSYAARARGVRSAMPMGRAISLCPDLQIVSAKHHLYSEASKKVMALLKDVTPLLEQISVDEAFLDVSDLPETAQTIGKRLQAQIKSELDLSSSVGIATNKLVAKIANDVGKKAVQRGISPFATTIVPEGQESNFLSPLPVEMLWGVGPKTAQKLAETGIYKIGEIANLPEKEMSRRFGKHGRDLSRHARGIDTRPVTTEREVKSISQETTFLRDISDDEKLEKTLRTLTMKVARRLRKADLAGKTVKLKIRWSDFTTLTRQKTLPTMTDSEAEIIEAALSLLKKLRPPGKPVRLIGVGVSGLGPPLRQLSLWEEGAKKSRELENILDELHERFGESIIQRGSKAKKEKNS
ncbi:MAG: DNA polymerase IV [Anaerolineae bacterium]|jgi:DNA polymerase-4|nr:DNA polymerase IV [Anaerolineae bacterium]MBT4310763.1 DNA polymerase IV [Anaerolineae bacterium]MBT4458239.1 DNA polymerase IV [Anaerolineae bacterium]MBT4841006.1 DNA polymerase IV [Anaerolineae bacterium]MBT6061120.1 DNA polymerase IV [Anaerolineae bacterium]